MLDEGCGEWGGEGGNTGEGNVNMCFLHTNAMNGFWMWMNVLMDDNYDGDDDDDDDNDDNDDSGWFLYQCEL